MNINIITRSLSLLLIIFTMCGGCNASPKNDWKKIIELQKELGYGKVMKDSISSIIFNAYSVTCELRAKVPTDTLRQDSIAKVPKRMVSALQFLILNPSNFQSDNIVFAHFNAWASYKFKTKKKQTVYLELDFGIRKWRLLDSNNHTICCFDMIENNMQLIYITRLLFPKDKTLELLINNLIAAKK